MFFDLLAIKRRNYVRLAVIKRAVREKRLLVNQDDNSQGKMKQDEKIGSRDIWKRCSQVGNGKIKISIAHFSDYFSEKRLSLQEKC